VNGLTLVHQNINTCSLKTSKSWLGFAATTSFWSKKGGALMLFQTTLAPRDNQASAAQIEKFTGSIMTLYLVLMQLLS
jgi:hypothetical protein